MNKILLMLSLVLFQVNLSYGQLNYEKTYAETLKKAAELKQPIFINIAPNTNGKIPAFISALDNKEVGSFYNKNFINYTVSVHDSLGSKLFRQYNFKILPAYLFMDHKGSIIFKGTINSTSSNKYLNMAKESLHRLSTGKVLSRYDDDYKSGKISRDFLKEYISLRIELEMFDNAKLIDDYVDYLTIGAFKDYSEVLFVLKAGPYANGKSYKLAYSTNLADSVFKSLPSAERKEIISRIINNTQNEAIRTKNLGYAQAAMNYMRKSWGSNYIEGDKQSRIKILSYYKAVKDTANYYAQAPYLYDTYFMKISADSIRKMEIKRQETMKNLFDKKRQIIDTQKQGTNTKEPGEVEAVVKTQSIYRIYPQNVANILNNAAYDYYRLGTKNGNHLTKALLWSKRAIELHPFPAYYDTLAHILYRLGFHNEAISTQNKAIEMALSTGRPKTEIEHLKTEAKKILENNL
jgi:tetratricopeptide (TPR) repeat protein